MGVPSARDLRNSSAALLLPGNMLMFQFHARVTHTQPPSLCPQANLERHPLERHTSLASLLKGGALGPEFSPAARGKNRIPGVSAHRRALYAQRKAKAAQVME